MDWLPLLLKTFRSPLKGMAMIRDRAPLGQAIVVALVVQGLYTAITLALFGGSAKLFFHPLLIFSALSQSGTALMSTLLAFVPSVLFVGNLIERRGGMMVAIKQEYAPLASCVLFAIIIASAVALPFAFLLRASGADVTIVDLSVQASQSPVLNPALLKQAAALGLYGMIAFPIYAALVVVGIREVFRITFQRALIVTILSAVVWIPAIAVLTVLVAKLSPLLYSPILLLMLFFFLRGYFNDVATTQRARLSFKNNLEASTLNPADASAHYNLGLLHFNRREFGLARERFERAVKVDADEVDAHYQLGRIARKENRWSDAIANFSEVVTRDDRHAQNEVWREIGETYLDAGQFADARDALEKFIERRQLDPKALYLMGRAEAGLGNKREAAAAMEACIEAVKTAPDFKYRAEKRWSNEARAFLRSHA